MLLVYADGPDRPLVAWARAQRQAGEAVQIQSPRYFAGPLPAATRVLLAAEHPGIRQAYEAAGVPVTVWATATASVPGLTAAPSASVPSPRYTVQPRGYGGWHDVRDQDGHVQNARALTREQAEALVEELTTDA